MPHLQFDINKALKDQDKIYFAENIRQTFADIMDTGTDHISISIRETGTYNLSIGRVKKPEDGVALVNADIRIGRTMEQRRELTLRFIELIHTQWNIPRQHIYVTLTEHKGEDFHLYEKFLSSWEEGEDPLVD